MHEKPVGLAGLIYAAAHIPDVTARVPMPVVKEFRQTAGRLLYVACQRPGSSFTTFPGVPFTSVRAGYQFLGTPGERFRLA
jgi:hypothetical protein